MSSKCIAIAGDWYGSTTSHPKAGHKDCPKPVRKPCTMQASKVSADWCQLTFSTAKGERLIVSVPWSSFNELQTDAGEAVADGAKDVKIADGKKGKRKK